MSAPTPDVRPTDAPTRDVWLIYFKPDELWWRAKRCGYTANVMDAGAYSEEEARQTEAQSDRGDEARRLSDVLNYATANGTVGNLIASRLEDAERRVSETERDARRLDFLEAMAMHATMNDFESGAVCEYVTENDDEPVEWDWEVPGASITQGELPLFHGKTLRASIDAAIAGTRKSGWVDGLLRDRDNYAAEFVAGVVGQDGGTEG